MKAADRLSQALGAHISESMGAHAGAGGIAGSSPFPAAVVHGGPGAGKYRGAARIKDAFAVDLDRLAAGPRPAAQGVRPGRARPPGRQPEGARPAPAGPGPVRRGGRSLGDRRRRAPLPGRQARGPGHAHLRRGQGSAVGRRPAGRPARRELRARGPQAGRAGPRVPRPARPPRLLVPPARRLAQHLAPGHRPRLALLDLPDDLQEKVDAGAVPASAASEAARIADASERREILARVEAGAMTRDDVTRAVKSRAAKGRGARPTPPIDDRPRRAGNGVKVSRRRDPEAHADRRRRRAPRARRPARGGAAGESA